jgi:hypothetical protein
MKKLNSIIKYIFPFPSLPNNAPAFMIIGAQKAGTTALYSFLSQHPGILATKPKEIHFFNCENRYSQGLEFYHAHFPLTETKQMTFDASPGYLSNPLAAKRIYTYNPHIKIIIILRDPVKRAFSAWNMYKGRYLRNENWFFNDWIPFCSPKYIEFKQRAKASIFNFEQYVLEEIEAQKKIGAYNLEAAILSHGFYAEQIERFYTYFPRKNILILENSELKSNTIGNLKKVEKFLGLQSHDWSTSDLSPVFEGDYNHVTIEECISSFLSQYYRPHNQKLYKLLGKDYAWS